MLGKTELPQPSILTDLCGWSSRGARNGTQTLKKEDSCDNTLKPRCPLQACKAVLSITTACNALSAVQLKAANSRSWLHFQTFLQRFQCCHLVFPPAPPHLTSRFISFCIALLPDHVTGFANVSEATYYARLLKRRHFFTSIHYMRFHRSTCDKCAEFKN